MFKETIQSIQIIDISAEVILEQTVSENRTSIDLTSMSKETYFLKKYTTSEVQSKIIQIK